MNDKCEYSKVTNSGVPNKPLDVTERGHWKYFFRQAIICSGVWSTHFQTGVICGTPTVLIPQMRREANSTQLISQEQESWISSTMSFSALTYVFLLPILAWHFGRRITQSAVVLASLAGYIALYLSNTVRDVFIGLALSGVLGAAISSIGLQVVTEYTSPANRGLYLSLQAATFYWGIWTANAIGTFVDWRYVAVVGICCSIYNAFTLLFWPESPYWLAAQGRVEQTRHAFKWLRGKHQDLKELEDLMLLNVSGTTKTINIRRFWNKITSKSFYKPMLLCALVIVQYHFQGKLVMSIYAINILKKITGNESKAYTGMLILDGVTVVGMYLGSFLTRRMRCRVQLLSFASGGTVCLLVMSLYLFLIRKCLIVENVYVSISLLSIYSICVCIGPIMLSMPLCGELMPLLLRNFATCVIAFYINIVTAIVLKVGAQPFITFGMDGGFLFFGGTSIVCFVLMYKFVPETKNKSILEISELVVGSKADSKIVEGLNN